MWESHERRERKARVCKRQCLGLDLEPSAPADRCRPEAVGSHLSDQGDQVERVVQDSPRRSRPGHGSPAASREARFVAVLTVGTHRDSLQLSGQVSRHTSLRRPLPR